MSARTWILTLGAITEAVWCQAQADEPPPGFIVVPGSEFPTHAVPPPERSPEPPRPPRAPRWARTSDEEARRGTIELTVGAVITASALASAVASVALAADSAAHPCPNSDCGIGAAIEGAYAIGLGVIALIQGQVGVPLLVTGLVRRRTALPWAILPTVTTSGFGVGLASQF
jgi:hypothetical protein